MYNGIYLTVKQNKKEFFLRNKEISHQIWA